VCAKLTIAALVEARTDSLDWSVWIEGEDALDDGSELMPVASGSCVNEVSQLAREFALTSGSLNWAALSETEFELAGRTNTAGREVALYVEEREGEARKNEIDFRNRVARARSIGDAVCLLERTTTRGWLLCASTREECSSAVVIWVTREEGRLETAKEKRLDSERSPLEKAIGEEPASGG
jgi:hypothetical protein